MLSVFVFHLNRNWLPGGFVGVDVFFVISGYLITSIIYRECQLGSFTLAKFYQRRIARIFPAFFTVAVATLVGARLAYATEDFAGAGASLVAAALSVANLTFIRQGNYFKLTPDGQPYLHYWSLSVEEQFYIFFPLLFILLYKYARKRQAIILAGLASFSFIACVLLVQRKPVACFYLLPTRAWELLAGCLLAVLSGRESCLPGKGRAWQWLSLGGLCLVVLSFFAVREGPHFPGFWTLLPVLGAVGVLLPYAGTEAFSEKWLAVAPLALIGRLSYSLYLWHWPIFSFIDYQFCLTSNLVRLTLKIGLSAGLTALSFWLIEKPARAFLNRPANRPWAYSMMVCALAVCVSLGIVVKRAYYASPTAKDVANGGLVFAPSRSVGSVVLMGDSNGSMYGNALREICGKMGCRLTLLGVDGGDPLPFADPAHHQLWFDSLAVVKKEKPDLLIFACTWQSKLKGNMGRLALAVQTLTRSAGHVALLNQPPILPPNASRAALREGARPPFFEDPTNHALRLEANEYLQRFDFDRASVVDIASHFETSAGEIRFLNQQDRGLYHDPSHLSGFGVDAVRPELERVIAQFAGAQKQASDKTLAAPAP